MRLAAAGKAGDAGVVGCMWPCGLAPHSRQEEGRKQNCYAHVQARAPWLGRHMRSLQQSSEVEPPQPNRLSCTHCAPEGRMALSAGISAT